MMLSLGYEQGMGQAIWVVLPATNDSLESRKVKFPETYTQRGKDRLVTEQGRENTWRRAGNRHPAAAPGLESCTVAELTLTKPPTVVS
jgi:hypothetical protein